MLHTVLQSLHQRLSILELTNKQQLGVKLEMTDPEPGTWTFERIASNRIIEAVTVEEEVVAFLKDVEKLFLRSRRDFEALDEQTVMFEDANGERKPIQLHYIDESLDTEFVIPPNNVWYKYAFIINRDNIALLRYDDEELPPARGKLNPLRALAIYLLHGEFGKRMYKDSRQLSIFFPELVSVFRNMLEPYIVRTDDEDSVRIKFTRRGSTLEISYDRFDYLYDVSVTQESVTYKGSKLSLEECKEAIDSWRSQSASRGSGFAHLAQV